MSSVVGHPVDSEEDIWMIKKEESRFMRKRIGEWEDVKRR